MKKKAIFSFFSGAGFLDLGFENSGYDVVYANEIYRPFLNAYRFARKKLGIEEPEYGYFIDDVKKLVSGKDKQQLTSILKKARLKYGLIGFIGGPPCPDFSVGGKNRGRTGKNGILTDVYFSLIVQQKPDFFLFENVKGLWSTKKHKEFYEEMKHRVLSHGYILAEKLINSIEYGAPQDRNRIILAGFSKDLISSIRPEYKNNVILSEKEFSWQNNLLYKKEKVFSLPWPEIDFYQEDSEVKIPSGIKEKLTVEYWFKKNNVLSHSNACNHFKPRQGLKRMLSVKEGDVSKKSYKRLHRWRYSPTAAYGNNEVHLHPYKSRRISVAEAMAIQSLPADFLMPPDLTLSDMFKAVGNGVPYLAAKGVAHTIKDFLS